MRIKSVWILVILLSLIVISGAKCQLRRGGADVSSLDEDVHKGNKGLELSFMQNLPPAKIYDNTDLHIVAELKNVGTTMLSGNLFLEGIDTNLITGIRTQKSFRTIDPKTQFNDEGGFETIEFRSSSIRLPKGTDKFPLNVVLSACYDYETLANPIICVEPDPSNIIKGGSCVPKDISLSGGQGAPVAITKVETKTSNYKAYFTIDIQNVGGGEVIDSLSRCPHNLEYDDINVVSYKVRLSNLAPFKCSPKIDGRSKVRLTNGKAKVTCSFNIPATHKFAYQTPLQVELDYGYMQSVQKSVEIIHIE